MGESTTFGDRLNVLFRSYLRPRNEFGKRTEWTNAQVARTAEHLYGRVMFTQETLRQARAAMMRRGPSVEVVNAIAHAFAFLAEDEPNAADAPSIAAYLCIDPALDRGAAPAGGDGQPALAVQDLRDAKFGPVGLMARLGDMDDPQALAAVQQLIEDLERRRAGGGGPPG